MLVPHLSGMLAQHGEAQWIKCSGCRINRGTGFELEAAQKSIGLGLGLVSMCERVSFLKGTISIESKRSVGTTIQVHLPISVP